MSVDVSVTIDPAVEPQQPQDVRLTGFGMPLPGAFVLWQVDLLASMTLGRRAPIFFGASMK